MNRTRIRSKFIPPLLILLWTVLPGSYAYSTPAEPFLKLRGEVARDAFGWAVACPGDVNGDGYGDLLVGAPGINDRPGKAYMYFGGPAVDSLPGCVLEDDGLYCLWI